MERTTNAKINIDKRRVKKDGTYPVKLSIYFKGIQEQYSTGVSFTEFQFEKYKNQKPIKGDVVFNKQRDALDKLCVKARAILLEIAVFDRREFSLILFGESNPADAKDVFKLLESKVRDLREEERFKYASTFGRVLSSLKKFRPVKTFSLERVDEKFLNDYSKWMSEQGVSRSTIGIYTRNLKVIFNDAIRQKIINSELYPFGRGRFSPPTSSNNKRALPVEEIIKIRDYDCEEGSIYHRARDYFMFSFELNGINFKDIALLKYQNVRGEEIGFVRAKTKNANIDQKAIMSHYSESLKEIVQMWGNSDTSPKNYIFPILNDSLSSEEKQRRIDNFIFATNRALKEIGKKLNLSLKLTTYAARHSYATIMQGNSISVDAISVALGHKSTKTTQAYLDSFNEQTRKRMSDVMSSILKK